MSNPIVFFGSGPVAAESLRLLAADFEVEAVITKPRPPHHKGDTPVLDLAQNLGLKTFEVTSKKELSDLFANRPVTSRLGIVIDFGIIISQDVIDYFELGIINSHFSLLPRWRGADPISFAILKGDAQTGVSLLLINDKLDEGTLLCQSTYDLPKDITTPELTDDLIELSHVSLKQILPAYFDGQIKPVEQTGEPTYSRKLTKQDSILDFNKSATELEREVRAFTGWPRSRTKIGQTDVVVTKAHTEAGAGTPGSSYKSDKKLGFYTSKDIFIINSLIPVGKKEMLASAFLAGYKF